MQQDIFSTPPRRIAEKIALLTKIRPRLIYIFVKYIFYVLCVIKKTKFLLMFQKYQNMGSVFVKRIKRFVCVG